jgi:Holliday junction resolvase-like predicted endonuclease
MATLQQYREERPHWSYSALNQIFNVCGLQFYFDRIVKLPKAFTPASLAFGSAYHRVMEWAALMRKQSQQVKAQSASELFHDVWSRQIEEDTDIKYDDGEDAETSAKLGRDMVECAVSNFDPEEEVVTVNEAFCVPLRDVSGVTLEKPLIGEFDLVVRKAGLNTIVDWKTAAKRWSKSKAAKDWQPTAFLMAHQLKHGTVPGFRFDVVTKNKTPAFESHVTSRSESDFFRFVHLVKLADSMIEANHFAPNEQGFYCSGCPHQEACKNWHVSKSRTHVRLAA